MVASGSLALQSSDGLVSVVVVVFQWGVLDFSIHGFEWNDFRFSESTHNLIFNLSNFGRDSFVLY